MSGILDLSGLNQFGKVFDPLSYNGREGDNVKQVSINHRWTLVFVVTSIFETMYVHFFVYLLQLSEFMEPEIAALC